MRRFAFVFAAITLSLVPRMSGAQDSSAYVRWSEFRKNPSTATLWSVFIPGGGQMYAEENWRGVSLFTGSAVGALLVVGALHNETVCDLSFDGFGNAIEHCPGRKDGMFYSGIALAVVPWLYSLVDAPQAAKRFNARHKIALRVEPAPRGRALRVRVSISR